MRLFGLLHLLGQASLRMEQALWPEDYERMTRKVKGVQREAEGDNAKSYIYEEVMQIRQERFDKARHNLQGVCHRYQGSNYFTVLVLVLWLFSKRMECFCQGGILSQEADRKNYFENEVV